MRLFREEATSSSKARLDGSVVLRQSASTTLVLVAYLYSGSELYADLVNHTNLTHENPDDPYISKSEALRRYGNAAKEALDRAVEPLGRLR
jgi:hypothetical protein